MSSWQLLLFLDLTLYSLLEVISIIFYFNIGLKMKVAIPNFEDNIGARIPFKVYRTLL